MCYSVPVMEGRGSGCLNPSRRSQRPIEEEEKERNAVSEFIVVPDTFLKYVTEFRKIPVPVDTDIETLRALVETLGLEASLGAEQVQPDLEPPCDGAISDR